MKKLILILLSFFALATTITASAEHRLDLRSIGGGAATIVWWSEDKVSDSDFLATIKRMVELGGYISIQNIPAQNIDGSEEKVSTWFKNTAGWLSESLVSPDEFIHATQFLLEQGHMKL